MGLVVGGPPYRWSYLDEAGVLVVAAGFGLGPTVAAANLLSGLGLLAENDTLDWSEQALADGGLVKAELLLNFGVTGPLPVEAVKHRIWVDCVDWLRTTLPARVSSYDLLMAEAFFDCTSGADRGYPARWRVVQPLVRAPRRGAKIDPDLIAVSFGGITTPYSERVHATEMPMAFLQALCAYLDATSSKWVEAFLPESLRTACVEAGIEHKRLNLRSLDRRGFLSAMSRCGLLICQPGLYTPFEALTVRVPFAVTYPMSFTQDRQWSKLRDLGICCCEPPWATVEQPGASRDIEELEPAFFEMTAEAWRKTPPTLVQDLVARFLADLPSAPYAPARTAANEAPSAVAVVASFLRGRMACRSV